ncbi:circadian clock KaiB family protein [Longimicrobium terrae]|uniref:Circadian clock protein KaiB n=1 Tax=Longimicrobium terrae TaxID=1639882 RepID=A0A841H6I1_9BACT|nr:circadian clock protein KaiB [Longimicrobium terrae]MBB6073544.1 circadian clock protein KaiB [Longimicrobium terrae]NNC32208.1 circadian clock protein KaiB [Longimicrobium terrae]
MTLPVTIRLVLYVAGDTPRTRSARDTLAWMQGGGVREPVEAEIVDVLDQPDRADAARVLLTPTLVREHPLPARRVVGDLGAGRRVAEALGLSPSTPTETRP